MSNKKTMKKSMVITTVVMVLLLIAALSTATFAWYTAQSNVTVTQTWITSASATSANLVIDNQPTTSSSATNTTVSLTMGGNIQPMWYNATAPDNTVDYDTFINNFVTFTVASGKYATAPVKGAPSEISNVASANASTGSSMYISNIGGSPTGVKATITIGSYYKPVETPDVANIATYYEKDANGAFALTEDTALDASKTYYTAETNNMLRVAIFVKVGEATDLTYVGTWGNGTINTSNIAIGTAAIGDAIYTPVPGDAITALASTNATIIDSLGSLESAEIAVVAWFEGDILTNAFANGGADFSISFSAN